MSNAIEFVLRLIDQASAPAQAASESLGDVSGALKEVGRSASETDKASKSLDGLASEIRKVQLEELKAHRSGASSEVLKEVAEKRKKLQIDREILKLEKQIKDEGDKQTNAQKEVSKAAGDSATKMGVVSGIASEITRRLLDAGRAAVNLAVQFGKAALDAATFKSDMIGGLEATMGSRDAAKGLAKELLGFKGADSFDAKAIAKAGKALTGVGFAADETMILVKTMADLAAGGAGDAAFGISDAIAKAKGTGRFNLSTLQSIAAAGGSAFSPQEVIAELGRTLGKSNDEVSKLLDSQGIDLDMALGALVRTTRDKVGGGVVGGNAAKGADTIPGLMAQLQGKFFNLVKPVEDSPGMLKLQGGLRNIVEILDEASPRGQRLQEIFDKMVDGLFGSLLGDGDDAGSAIDKILDGLDAVATVVGPIIKVVKALGEGLFDGFTEFLGPLFDVIRLSGGGSGAIEVLSDSFRTLGRVIGWVAGALVLGVGTIVSGVAYLADLATRLVLDLADLGVFLVEGLWNGIKKGWGWMLDKFTGLVDLLPGAVKSALGIQSPSRVMMELGVYTGEGFSMGLEKAANDVDLAMADLVAPPSAPRLSAFAGGGAMGGFGGAFAPVINVNVDAAGATQEDAEAISERVGEAVRIELVRFLEEAGLAAGVA